jgi:hypothetical protein
MLQQRKQDGWKMMNKQQRDEYERKKILWIIKDLRARGVHNSADKVEETYKYIITLAK